MGGATEDIISLAEGSQRTPQDVEMPVDSRINDGSTREHGSCFRSRKLASWWQCYSLHAWTGSRKGKMWSASWAHIGPLSGLISLSMVVGSLIASIGILSGSDNQPVENWPTPPSTFIAAFTAFSNLGVRYGLAQGAIVTWWRRAVHGTTLSKLHTDWRASTGVRGALSAGRHMGLVGIACLFSTVILIDGPLLQRASTVESTNMPVSQNLRVSMAPELPRGFSGYWTTIELLGLNNTRPHPAFNATIPTTSGTVPNNVIANGTQSRAQALWEVKAPLRGVVEGCKGECRATIRAPAVFARSCTMKREAVNPSLEYNTTAVYYTEIAPPLQAEVFQITTNLLVTNRTTEAIGLIAGSAELKADCAGEFVYRICNFESGIGEYDVVVQNGYIDMDTLAAPRFVAFANNTAVDNNGNRPCTLASVVNYMRLKWESFYAVYTNRINGNVVVFGDIGVTSFVEPEKPCWSYRDPFDDMVKEMNKLMVYLGAAAAAAEDRALILSNMDDGLFVDTEVVGHTTISTSVYRTRYWFLIAAAIVDVACVAIIVPLFGEWWIFGRPVSFSPLEIAKAFKSPLLSAYHSNSTANDLGTSTDDVAIQYGAEQDHTGSDVQLAFGSPADTKRPPRRLEVAI